MKIGIASDDQVMIAQHFGRTRGFVIADILENTVRSKSYRVNDFTVHMQGGDHDHGEHGHSHSAILDALADCDLVIARGMGQRIYDDLKQAHIQALITSEETVENAVQAFLKGALTDHPEQSCQH